MNDRPRASTARIVLTVALFGLMSVSIWFLIAAGTRRGGPDERPEWLVPGFAGFGIFLLLSAVIGLVRPRWRETSGEIPGWAWVLMWTMFIGAIISAGIYDLVVD